LLKPPQDTGAGYKDPNLDLVLQGHLELMRIFLWQFISGGSSGWMAASLTVACAAECGPWLARHLREWSRAYIINREAIPTNIYG